MVRRPTITRVCFHLNWIFLALWGLYALGPDVSGALPLAHEGRVYQMFSVGFFLFHFVLISTSIIALFVVIIEIYARRTVRGLRSVLVGMGLPIASFLYFAVLFLAGVERWLEHWR